MNTPRWRIAIFCLLTALMPFVIAQQPNVAVRETSNTITKVAVIEERLRGMEVALQLQAQKYEERLELLNHAHDKQVADQATYLEKSVYQANQKDLDTWKAGIDSRLTIIESRQSGAATFRDTSLNTILALISLAGTLISLAGFVFMFVTRRRDNRNP